MKGNPDPERRNFYFFFCLKEEEEKKFAYHSLTASINLPYLLYPSGGKKINFIKIFQ